MAWAPVVFVIPWASLDTIAATGSPGIKRGRMKFSKKARTKVIKNQSSLLRKYFRYPFNAAPPHPFCRYYTYSVTIFQVLHLLIQKQPCSGMQSMAVFIRLRVHKLQ